MNDDERIGKLNSLYTRQSELFDSTYQTSSNESLLSFSLLSRPNFEIDQTTIVSDLKMLDDISYLDESVFAKWRIADLPVMITAGGLGTLASVYLKDFLAEIHDEGWAKKNTVEGGHSGEMIDTVPGYKQPGGFGHRWKFGHDLLNPFEIDWSQYLELAKESGGSVPVWLKAIYYWLKHLFQDTFSAEGLPVPGHSLLRHFLNPSDPTTRSLLQILTTIKMRDIAGAGITNCVMAGYLWGTEKELKRVFIKPNYRAFSLMLGANIIALLSGLLVPPPFTSFNHGTIPVIAYYALQLIRLEKQVRKVLAERDNILDANESKINCNDEIISALILFNHSTFQKLLEYEKEVMRSFNSTIQYHEKIRNMVCCGGQNANSDFSGSSSCSH
jgi:hypothetical protein